MSPMGPVPAGHRLSPREAAFVGARVSGLSVEQAAAAIGATRRTGFRWAKRPAIVAAQAAAIDTAYAVTTGMAAMLAQKAVRALEAVVDNPEHPDHVRACLALLARVPARDTDAIEAVETDDGGLVVEGARYIREDA